MASSSPRDEALAAKIKERAGPEVFCVFDLDRTLWNGDCQRFSKPAELQLYPEVPRIIEALNRCGIPWAVASANPNRDRCLWLLQAHGLLAPGQGFAGIGARLERGADIAAEVFPGGKRPHLERIKRAVGRPWNSMLFFDDLPWNVQQADKLGAVGVRVEAGMTVEVLLSGLQRQRERRHALSTQQGSMQRWLSGGSGAAQSPASSKRAAASPQPQQQRKKQQVSHEAALTALRTVTGDRCDTPTLEALLSRHGGDAGLAAAAFYEDPRLEPGAARHISE